MCNQRKKTLDHLYSTHRDAYKVLHRPPFGKFDHNSVVRWRGCYTQDCFVSTDWNMFRDSSNGIEEYTTSVIGFFNKFIEDIIPTVCTYPNQKPWITSS